MIFAVFIQIEAFIYFSSKFWKNIQIILEAFSDFRIFA